MAREAGESIIDKCVALQSQIYIWQQNLIYNSAEDDETEEGRGSFALMTAVYDAIYTKRVVFTYLDPFNSSCNSAVSTASSFFSCWFLCLLISYLAHLLSRAGLALSGVYLMVFFLFPSSSRTGI